MDILSYSVAVFLCYTVSVYKRNLTFLHEYIDIEINLYSLHL